MITVMLIIIYFNALSFDMTLFYSIISDWYLFMEYLVCSLQIKLQNSHIYTFVKYTTFKISEYLEICASFAKFDLIKHVILNYIRHYNIMIYDCNKEFHISCLPWSENWSKTCTSSARFIWHCYDVQPLRLQSDGQNGEHFGTENALI